MAPTPMRRGDLEIEFEAREFQEFQQNRWQKSEQGRGLQPSQENETGQGFAGFEIVRLRRFRP